MAECSPLVLRQVRQAGVQISSASPMRPRPQGHPARIAASDASGILSVGKPALPDGKWSRPTSAESCGWLCWAPDIVETILAARPDQPLMLCHLERPLPASWEEQRRRELSAYLP